MTPAQLAQHIADLQTKRTTLEQEAKAHEQAARDKRAEMAQVKDDLSDLRKNLVEAETLNSAQQALKSAQDAKSHAESHANSLASELKVVENLRKELEKSLKDLKDNKNKDA
jgi:chromosome segregation ATPase